MIQGLMQIRIHSNNRYWATEPYVRIQKREMERRYEEGRKEKKKTKQIRMLQKR